MKYLGLANEHDWEIYLNPTIPLKCTHAIGVGFDLYTPTVKLRLREGEQYFLTLLHEIGHFEVHLPVSKE